MHVYHTVAVHFADLHDTPERMLRKGCINEIVAWQNSRSFFYWRLRRLILEDYFVKKIIGAQSGLGHGQAKCEYFSFCIMTLLSFIISHLAMLHRWFIEDKGETSLHAWSQNEAAVKWLEEQKESGSIVNQNIKVVIKDAKVSQIREAVEVRFFIIFKQELRILICYLMSYNV